MQVKTNKVLVISAIILFAALSRIIPHPMNFAPLGAMALFGAAYFGKKGSGLLWVMLAWFLSDVVLNNFIYSIQSGFSLFTKQSIFIYGSIVLIYALGKTLFRKFTVGRMLVGSLSASVIFFAISNFGVWMQGGLYPMTWEGLITCYSAAIPFFQSTLSGDLIYSGLLFIAYEKLFRQQLDESRVEK